MTDTPDFATVAALIGDRARAQMLGTLMGGQALTATELAGAASVTKATASAHLRKLLDARLVGVTAQGRHRYYRLADRDVADVLERLIGLADNRSPARVFGPRDPLMRKARVCYDHIAGELGVLANDSLTQRGLLRLGDDGTELCDAGVDFFTTLGIDVAALGAKRRPLCRACLDWSERRYHLGGSVGAALLRHCIDRGWAHRERSSRSLLFSATGERAFRRHFPRVLNGN
jgi:DNA-binding transcriptional ArsR family regulator